MKDEMSRATPATGRQVFTLYNFFVFFVVQMRDDATLHGWVFGYSLAKNSWISFVSPRVQTSL